MDRIIKAFKKIIRFSVSIFASREFGFVYCIIGTMAQVAHTYYLIESVSSLSGNWKMMQAMGLSIFISSSLLFFTAIADNSDQSKESKRILVAVNLFMIIEILINFYYYSRHLLLDAQEVQIFDFFFAVLVSCLIPVTIKLYAGIIKARDWMDEMEGVSEISGISKDEIEKRIDDYLTEQNLSADFVKQVNEVYDNFETFKSDVLKNINNEVSEIFNDKQKVFIKQFENKMKMLLNEIKPQQQIPANNAPEKSDEQFEQFVEEKSIEPDSETTL